MSEAAVDSAITGILCPGRPGSALRCRPLESGHVAVAGAVVGGLVLHVVADVLPSADLSANYLGAARAARPRRLRPPPNGTPCPTFARVLMSSCLPVR